MQETNTVFLSHTALYSSERMMSDLVNKFTEIGPASLDFCAGDTAPVQLSQKVFDHYLGGVKVEKTDADKMCQVMPTVNYEICEILCFV